MVGLICYRLKSRTVTIDDMVAVISRNEVGKEFEPRRTRKYGQMKPVQLMLALYHEQKAMVNFWVAGASGNVGREVVKELRRLDQTVAAAALNEADAAHIPAVGVETVFLNFGDAAASTGVRQVFLLRRPPQYVREYARDYAQKWQILQ